MTLAEDLQRAIDAIYSARNTEECIYTPLTGDAKTVRAIIEHDLQQYGDVADVSGKTAVISVRASELGYGPRRNETYTIGGKVYTVDSLLASDELEHRALTV